MLAAFSPTPWHHPIKHGALLLMSKHAVSLTAAGHLDNGCMPSWTVTTHLHAEADREAWAFRDRCRAPGRAILCGVPISPWPLQ